MENENFHRLFGEDGNVMVVGVQGEGFYTPKAFAAWSTLGEDLKAMDAVDSVFSEAHMFSLLRDDSLMRFRLVPVMDDPPRNSAEMDTLMARVHALPFYRGLLCNGATRASLMMADAWAAFCGSIPIRSRRLALVMRWPLTCLSAACW